MIRVLIVDDSATARAHLARLIGSTEGFEVSGVAGSTEEALEQLSERSVPDLVCLDVMLGPQAGDAASAVRAILALRRIPIVLVSNIARTAPEVFDAICAGALELLPKPGAFQRAQSQFFMERLRALSRQEEPAGTTPALRAEQAAVVRHRVGMVVIGASSGGPAALKDLLSEFPADLGVPVLVAQHLAPGFEVPFIEWLSRGLQLPVRVAREAELIREGRILVARPGTDLVVASQRRAFSRAPPPQGHHPSVDALFSSATRAVKAEVACVVLSGMGSDGALGAAEVAAAGGLVLAQDRESCSVFGMPGACAAKVPSALTGAPRRLGRLLAAAARV